MKKKKFRYSLNSKAFIIGAVVVVLLLNAILISLDSKIPLEFDFTGDGIYALTDESKEIVDQIKEPTEILFLTDGEDNGYFSIVRNVLDKYSQRNSNITVREVDLIKNPFEVQQYMSEVRYAGSLVIRRGERYKIVDSSNFFNTENGYSYIENAVTTKLAAFVDDLEESTLYFTVGHGEYSSEQAKIAFKDYTIKDLNCQLDDFPTEKESVVFIVAPQADFSPEEIDKLDKYLEKGGNVQIYFDPVYSEDELLNLCSYLTEDWGIVYSENTVLDNSAVFEGTLFMAGELGEHDITNPIKESQKSVVYGPANSFTVAADKPSSVKIQTLLSSTDKGYAVDEEKIVENGKFDVVLAAMKESSNIQNEIVTSRLIVGGSVLFFDNAATNHLYANEDVLLNSVNWMAGGDASVTVRAKSIASGHIVMKTSQVMTWLVILVLVIPLATLACGIVVFVKRRHK